MIRLRSSLLLLVIAALLLSGTPVFADTGPGLDAGRCTEPGPSPAGGTPVASLELALSTFENDTFCSCNYCRTHPDEICRISPSGYSTLCSNYYQNNC